MNIPTELHVTLVYIPNTDVRHRGSFSFEENGNSHKSVESAISSHKDLMMGDLITGDLLPFHTFPSPIQGVSVWLHAKV